MDLNIEKSNENIMTSLLAIRQMTPLNRKKFYASEEGREIVKGLILESETAKKADKKTGMNWTPEEIEATIVALRAASEDDFKIFLQLLPGHIAGRISEHVNTAKSNNGLEPNKVEKSQTVPLIEKGAKIGTAGYELWLAKRRTHNKVNLSEANKPIKTGTTNPKPSKTPAIPSAKGPKTPKPIGYGKFIAKKPKK